MTSTGPAGEANHIPSWRFVAAAGLTCGLYVSAFYIAANRTMLPPPSILLLAAVLTMASLGAVLGTNLVLRFAKLQRYAGFATAFVVGMFLLLALRQPIFAIPAIRDFREQMDGTVWVIAHAAYYILLATLCGFIFRRSINKLAWLLAVMTVVAIVPAFRGDPDGAPSRVDAPFLDVKLDRRPNIYLLLADSFASFAYMRSRGIDTTAFEARLKERGFRVYDDTFANYHSTLDSMLATLEMQHHYYRQSRKQAEVTETARQIVGGNNNLVRFLKNNGYRTRYIHQGPYLLIQGCTADDCYRADDYTYAGGRFVLKELLPKSFFLRLRIEELETTPFDVMRHDIASRLEEGRNSGAPEFQYIHLYAPGHVRNNVVGRCDEGAELAKYAGRVTNVIPRLEAIIDDIVRADPDAVIVLSGDHGPFIANRCELYVDISTVGEYRDRVGALTAIRWPQGYDGRFDAGIKTNVNLFRFVLASLIDGSDEALGGRVPDDVFVHGSDGVLKILDDGRMLAPPVVFAPEN